jgi:hypothetical protein
MWKFLNNLKKCIGCNEVNTNMPIQCNPDLISSNDITYVGPNLTCLKINTGDSLTLVLIKLDNFLCNTSFTTIVINNIIDNITEYPTFTTLVNDSINCEDVYGCFTTTTTTTALPVTTTTTTSSSSSTTSTTTTEIITTSTTTTKGCSLFLNDDYSTCNESSSVIIDILANDSITLSSVVSISTLPTLGTVVLNADNTITYTSTSGVIGDVDSFQYTVTDDDCFSSATVNIYFDSPLEPLPTFNSITLHRNNALANGCNQSPGTQNTFYIDTTELSTAISIYNDINGLYTALAGYYTNGIISRYWNGISFTEEPINCIQL